MPKPKIPCLFRYSGSKRNLIPLMRLPASYKRLVEPYLGSGCYALQSQGPALGFDVNSNIVDLWNWLKNDATPERLRELQKLLEEAVDKDPNRKPDVRNMGLSHGEMTYVRINVTGVYVGQLSSWKVYPQHSLPIDQTISLLPRLKDIDVRNEDAEKYIEQEGDLVFIDPPYTLTRANYKQDGKNGIEETYNPSATVDLISRLTSPIIFTYGTNAKEVFPEYEWEVLKQKKVPRIRGGGTVDRTEHVCYLNWRQN